MISIHELEFDVINTLGANLKGQQNIWELVRGLSNTYKDSKFREEMEYPFESQETAPQGSSLLIYDPFFVRNTTLFVKQHW